VTDLGRLEPWIRRLDPRRLRPSLRQPVFHRKLEPALLCTPHSHANLPIRSRVLDGIGEKLVEHADAPADTCRSSGSGGDDYCGG
jgi:hypothetical protein